MGAYAFCTYNFSVSFGFSTQVNTIELTDQNCSIVCTFCNPYISEINYSFQTVRMVHLSRAIVTAPFVSITLLFFTSIAYKTSQQLRTKSHCSLCQKCLAQPRNKQKSSLYQPEYCAMKCAVLYCHIIHSKTFI